MKPFILIMALLQGGISSASSPGVRYPFFVTSNKFGSSFAFLMSLGKGDPAKSGEGICFEAKDDGTLEKRWSVSGWYSHPHSLLLSSDGRTLVRILSIPRNDDADALGDMTCLGFYVSGKLVKEVKLRELFPPEKIKGLQFDLSMNSYNLDEDARFSSLNDLGDVFDELPIEDIEKKSSSGGEVFVVTFPKSGTYYFSPDDGRMLTPVKVR